MGWDGMGWDGMGWDGRRGETRRGEGETCARQRAVDCYEHRMSDGGQACADEFEVQGTGQ
eukprot:763515-Hanusia_phi.AAC.1